jgi:Fungal specific transcription factor domain
MEGIKAVISSSTIVSPTDTTTPSSNQQPRPRRSHSARFPVNDVDSLVLPPRRTADHLVDLYFKYVHTLYPYLHEPSFRSQYEKLWTHDSGHEDDPLFYCLLNLVLALGCQFSTLFESSIHSGDTFFNRAKTLLGFSIFDVGTLQVVQALLLMGSYLQSTNRPNRCWNVLGMGIRVAQGLGLHIERSSGDLVERETRRRAWWGCVLMDRYFLSNFPTRHKPDYFRILAMLFGRPLMIHDQDAYLVHLPIAQDDQYIMPTSILPSAQPSKMTFYIATCQLYRILGDILRELYSPRDDYRTMKEEEWLSKVSSIMRFDKELKDWLSSVPTFLQWGSEEEVSEDILRQRNVLQVRMLNVRNLLYRPSLILLGRRDYAGDNGLDLSTTLTCARFCVASAKDTIQLLHSTASRLTGAFWYNIFCISCFGIHLTK